MSLHARQAIETKYFGPSNVRGSRVKAKAAAGSITIPYDDSLNSVQAHAKAAKALASRFGWNGAYHVGGTADDRGYVFVCTSKDTLAWNN